MVVSISGRVHRFNRLSFSEIRCVPPKPLTLALTRFDCREASNSYTSVAGIPFARAMLRIGSLIRESCNFVYLLNKGAMYTGAIRLTNARKSIVTAAPHTHQLLPRRRTTRIHGPNV